MNAQIQPIRRNLHFNLPKDRISDWHPGGLHVSHFFNTLSIFFPDGERFFIDSVRLYRDKIQDPELQEAVRGFIGQEAMHGREHEEYNDALTQRGLPADVYGKRVLKLLRFLQRYTPKASQLSATIALEHLTAILANNLLRDPRVLGDAEPHFHAVWRWHALEETEHKAVAFDVYQAALGKGPLAYLQRCFGLLAATLIFWSLVIPFHIGLLRREGQLWNFAGWGRVFKFLWITPGALRRPLLDWLDYFRPGFHPWDHDNRVYLDQIDELEREVSDFNPATEQGA